jgi:hypothetical protein
VQIKCSQTRARYATSPLPARRSHHVAPQPSRVSPPFRCGWCSPPGVTRKGRCSAAPPVAHALRSVRCAPVAPGIHAGHSRASGIVS